jgi:transposase
MPWKESSVMEERLRFVARLLDGEGMSDVCRSFGISQKTGYKIFNRYKEHGLEALYDRSRRPVRYANQLPQPIEQMIVRLKREKPHWGARKIRELLVRRLAGDVRVPAKSTVHAVLDRHGLVKRGRQRRCNKAQGTALSDASAANQLVGKYADHLPLYRQAQIMHRQGIDLDRSTLADWVGRAAFELRPVFERLVVHLKASTKLFMDETRAPVLDPGRKKTKTGYLWALARDDRPWGGADPPGVAYFYAPGRGGKHAEHFLADFSGALQVDGYAGYNRLTNPTRSDGLIELAYCWAHARRKLYEIAQSSTAPIAEDGLKRIARFYRIEAEIRGQSPEHRRANRQARTKPLIEDLEKWVDTIRARVSGGSRLGQALRYIAKHRDGLRRFLDDGRIEIDSNVVERSIRPIALNRKNALFAGHDEGAKNWGMIASLIETCKLNDINPQAYLETTLSRIVDIHPQNRIDELLPWANEQPPVNVA